MNEQPSGFWQRTWNEPRHFFLWLTFLSLAGIVIVMVLSKILSIDHSPGALQTFAIVIMAWLMLTGALGIVGLVLSLIPATRRWMEGVLRRRFFVLACILTLIALIVAEEDWRGWRAWNDFKTQWEAKGENFDFHSLIPPAVPDEQNFAMSPVWIAQTKLQFGNDPAKARDWYGDRINDPDVARWLPYLLMDYVRTNDNRPTVHLGDWRSAEPTDLKAWQEYYRNPPTNHSATEFTFPPQPQSPADDVLLALSKYDLVIDQLRKDSERPSAQFPIHYVIDPGWDILLPHLAWLKQGGMVLALQTSAEVEKGNTQTALNDEKLIWRFIDSMQTEPFLISHLVRIAEIQIAIQPIWEGLAKHRWSDAELAELEQGLGRFDFLTDFKLAARGERNLGVNAIEYTRRTGCWPDTSASAPTMSPLIPQAFWYQNELSLARMEQQWILASADLQTRIVSPAQVRQNDRQAERELQFFSPYHVFARMLVPAFENAVKRFAQAQATLDMARVAIALERYRLAHGEFPETLDTLSPQFLAQVPHDVIGGQPLHYWRTSDGQFVLYSVGWNEKDDGGVVVFKKRSGHEVNADQGDWVWKYPGK
jgi:hypothetical protein